MIPSDKPYVIVDVETTGGSPLGHRVIEVAAIRVQEGREEVFSTLVHPERPVSPFIFQLTGISPMELERAPVFSDVIPELSRFLEGAIFVAHNARFDYSFIKTEFKRCGQSFSSPTLCTVRLSQILYKEHRRHDLSTLIERFAIPCPSRHRALDDARATHEFMKRSAVEKGEFFTKIFVTLSSKRLAQCHIPQAQFDALPEGPGVYIFGGEDGTPLYIGKSLNVRERVLSHFYEDHHSGRHLQLVQKAHSVTARTAPGELSALLLESELIKRLSPLLNRKLVKRKSHTVWLKETDAAGRLTVRIAQVESLEDGKVLKLFKSKAGAKKQLIEIARERGLCMKVLGLEQGDGACFGHQLKKCPGTCVGLESVLRHNVRFLEAFGPPAIKSWPYKGAILVEEPGADAESEPIVVDQWKLRDQPFDWDIYRILESAMRKKRLKIRAV